MYTVHLLREYLLLVLASQDNLIAVLSSASLLQTDCSLCPNTWPLVQGVCSGKGTIAGTHCLVETMPLFAPIILAVRYHN